jgi:hypothetical protein
VADPSRLAEVRDALASRRLAPWDDVVCPIHRRARRGIQEEVTMLELFILAAGFAGGFIKGAL